MRSGGGFGIVFTVSVGLRDKGERGVRRGGGRGMGRANFERGGVAGRPVEREKFCWGESGRRGWQGDRSIGGRALSGVD